MAGFFLSQSDFIDEITYKIFKHLHTSRYVCPVFAHVCCWSSDFPQIVCVSYVRSCLILRQIKTHKFSNSAK